MSIENDMARPPAGAWYRESADGGFVIGASRRSAGTVVILALAVLWAGLPVGPWKLSPLLSYSGYGTGGLFAASYLLGILLLLYGCVVSVFGKIEVRWQPGAPVSVFHGVGSSGNSQTVELATITEIRRELDAGDRYLVLSVAEGKPIIFGGGLSERRRRFLSEGLQRILAQVQ